jgi:3-methyladenine DNA glycosylase AlkD
MNGALLTDIKRELERNVDPSPKCSPQTFFKEEVKFHGVKSNLVERIARERFKQIQASGKGGVFALCEVLLKTDYGEEAAIACDWAYRLRDSFEPDDFEVFEHWLTTYVNNWAKCDTLCNHTVAAFVEMYPEYLARLKRWTHSENRWLRRAAAVTLILPARKGNFLQDVFEIADSLLTDADDLVQKGYGWMLKEASKPHQREVFDYILTHRVSMPRTALRYAIEKMPDDMRRRAMARD